MSASRIPRPRTWLGRENGRRVRITRSPNADYDDDDDTGIDVRSVGKGKDIFSSSMGDVLESIFQDIDNEEDVPVKWEDAMGMMIKVTGKAAAMGATLVVSHGILIGIRAAFQKMMVFKW